MSKLVNEDSIPALLAEMSVKEKVDLLTGKSMFSSPEMPQYGIPSILYLDGATGVNLMQYMGELVGMSMGGDGSQDGEASLGGDDGAENGGAKDAAQGAKEEAQGSESNNESGSAFMGLVSYATNSNPLPEDMPEKTKQIILHLRALIDSVRPNGEEPGCFPPGMLLGATWKPELIYKVGEAVGREAQAYGVDVLLGTPNTNIHRDPRNGRLFESFSEDPFLSSKMAPEFSRGVQDQDMVADVKHFAANNQETLRQGINEHISERALREIYLPGFEAAVKEGKVGTVMSAYNSINGKPCAHNDWLLTQVLKEEWGFEGQVVSDWGAVYDQVEALKAGNDMDMPGPRGKERLYRAIESGEISEERLNDAVARTLRMILQTPKFRGRKYTAIDNELSREAAYNAAVEGITLLKNDGVLPLAKDAKVALFGKLSERFMESGAGSAQVDTGKFTSLLAEVKGKASEVLYGEIGAGTDTVIITAGSAGQEGSDRAGLEFDPADKAMLAASVAKAKAAGKRIILLLNVAGPVDLMDYVDDVNAIVCLFFPGMEGARATADILFGDANPSGKLPLTFPKHYRDCPTSKNFPGEFGEVTYGEGIYVGYRYYDYKGIEPLYPFGYGLSYTKFELTDISVSDREYDNQSAKPLLVTVKVKNTGTRAGKEVVQLYVRDEKSTLDKPEKELKAFAKVELAPGEEKCVEMELVPRSFASYDTSLHQWAAEPGVYGLLAGNSSANITQSIRIMLTGKNPYALSMKSSIGSVAAEPKAVAVCRDVLGAAFDTAAFQSQAVYFVGTPLEKYLSGVIAKIAGDEKKREEIVRRINEGLGKIERIHETL